jgi:hypothetical protein
VFSSLDNLVFFHYWIKGKLFFFLEWSNLEYFMMCILYLWHFIILVTKNFHWNANKSPHFTILATKNFHWNATFMTFYYSFIGMQTSSHFTILVTKNFHWNANFHHILHFLQPKTFIGMQTSLNLETTSTNLFEHQLLHPSLISTPLDHVYIIMYDPRIQQKS